MRTIALLSLLVGLVIGVAHSQSLIAQVPQPPEPLTPGESAQRQRSASPPHQPVTDPANPTYPAPGTLPSQAPPPAPALPQPPVPTGTQRTGASAGTVDGIQFPKTSVFEVLTMYEALTGKRLIRDSNLAGPELSIMVNGPIPKDEAIRIIESSLLLNGYSIVPVDASTVKILGPSRAPRTEGLPLYTEAALLTTVGDRVVSFFRPLQFITPEDAIAVVQGVIQTNAFGVITPAPTANALIITDKTPVIFKALSVLELIDREPAQVVTRFIQLQRANAEKVVEMLDEMFGTANSATNPARPAAAPPQPANPEGAPLPANPAAAGGGTAQYEDRLLIGKTKFLADRRTNRILVVTRTENFRYLNEVITQLDAAGSFEQPYVRALNYLSVVDAFPVLTEMLRSADDESTGTGATPQATPGSPFTQGSGTGGGLGGGSSSGSTGSLGRPDRLSDEAMQSPPLSASLGEIQIIGDPTANSVIVYGPPDGKERARQILDLLDQRPKQVYLAAVIGQMRLGDGLDYGVSYFVRYQNFAPIRNLLGNSDQSGAAGSVFSPLIFNNLLGSGNNGGNGSGADLLPDPSSLINPNSFAALSGLTVYGTIAESVDIFARALETTDRFQTLARPVVYTTNNKKATILSGEKVPVPTSTLTTATGGGVNNTGSAVTSNIQYQDVVLKLEVIPLINANGEVNLVIAQTNDNIAGFDTISDNRVPRIATQEITTSVRVPNGSTIVLGGLITEDESKSTDGIPYISKIPYVGPLLGGGSSRTSSKRELLVMIQPVVVEDNESMRRASMGEGERTKIGSDLHELAARPAEFYNAAAPTPVPPAKKKSWLPWLIPKRSE
ncbi:MAG: type II secretion system secretin GspD [Terrimicrobiaceae bacterium]